MKEKRCNENVDIYKLACTRRNDMQVCRHYSKDIRYDYLLILDYKQTIYYFSVGDEIDLTDLLTWCQMVLKGYPFFSIKDLTRSWRSGCELGRLIHTYRPELM